MTPGSPISVEEMRWQERTYPGGRRFIAWLDGAPVGAGGAGRAYSFPPDFPGLWGNISVLPDHRRRGIGSAILAAVSRAWRAMLARRCSSAGRRRTGPMRSRSSSTAASRARADEGRAAGPRRRRAAGDRAAGRASTISSLEARPGARPGGLRGREGGDARTSRATARALPATLEEFRIRDVDRSIDSAGRLHRRHRRRRPAASSATPT